MTIHKEMTTRDFNKTLLVNQSPKEVFKAILNVRGWWSGLYAEEIDGNSSKLNDEFIFHAGGGAHYSKQKLIELIPDKKIVWLVTESKLTFLETESEWTGSKISFEISDQGDNTKILFTHVGLVPEIECYNSCAPAWSQYLEEKLLSLINQKRNKNDNSNQQQRSINRGSCSKIQRTGQPGKMV